MVSKTTLYNRINGRRDQALYGVTKQRPTPEEEKSIENWVVEIQSWGFPPRVAQLREMAEELLQARGDYKELGINWTSGFLACHPMLQSKHSRTLDQDRFLQEWFDLYRSIKAEHGVLDKDTYSMDGNWLYYGVLLGSLYKIPKTSVYKTSWKSEMGIFDRSNWYNRPAITVVYYFKRQKMER